MITPLRAYQDAIACGQLESNSAQYNIMRQLNNACEKITKRCQLPRFVFKNLQKLRSTRITGFYFHGTVGIGKTMLMDIFFNHLDVQNKLREHFHVFMRRLHHDLRDRQGEVDPLLKVADTFSSKYDVICFDEFFVNEVGDAMLLGTLFKALFERGVIILMTSNIAPDDLYLNGLQRDRFVPTIKLIKSHSDVIHLEVDQDYRLRQLTGAGIYFTPADDIAANHMRDIFQMINKHHPASTLPILILDREIPIHKAGNRILWIDFHDICGIPRSQNDYLELIKQFDYFIVSDIPKLTDEATNLIIMFIKLIDILYDHRKKIIASAECDIQHIYTQGEYRFEFERTQSRLIEMQSMDYFQA